MQFIQPTPAMQLCQVLEANEAAHAHTEAVAHQPFVPTEYVPLTLDDLKARAIQATEESQADKGIARVLHTCGECATVWRSQAMTLCPTCALDTGTILFLDGDQRINLHDAAYAQKKVRASYTNEQLRRALDEFRALLDEYAPWYDRTSR